MYNNVWVTIILEFLCWMIERYDNSLSLFGFARPRYIIKCQITILLSCIRVNIPISNTPQSSYIESPKVMNFHKCNYHFVTWWKSREVSHMSPSHSTWWENQVKRALSWVYEKGTNCTQYFVSRLLEIGWPILWTWVGRHSYLWEFTINPKIQNKMRLLCEVPWYQFSRHVEKHTNITHVLHLCETT